MILSKQSRQANRLAHNQTKATKLCIKQSCNKAIKGYFKNKSISDNVKQRLIKFNLDIIASLYI